MPILFRGDFVVPAGVDVADPNELKSFLSFLGGLFNAQANGIAASLIDGVL